MDASLPLLREVVNSSSEAQLQGVLHRICECSPAALRDTIHRLCESSPEARIIMCEDLILKKLKEKDKEMPAMVPNAGREAEAGPKVKAKMATGHKRKREQNNIEIEDRWQTCENCHKIFDINKNGDRDCVSHIGELTFNWPGVVLWSCCANFRGHAGCEVSAHTPEDKEFKEFKAARHQSDL